MMHQPQLLSPATERNGSCGSGSTGDAPPKQVAQAMERLGQAARLIADVRLGSDRLLEAILATADPRQSSNSTELIARADASMRKDLQDLRTLGRQLEVSGVLNESLRSRGDSWGLHMPLVCPDGAVVAYAWKRQLAGQAGASAVDRTRLALKAFNDQKKRFFPNLEDDSNNNFSGESRIPKRQCSALGFAPSNGDNLDEVRTLAEVLSGFEKETTAVRISTHQRLDWLKKATLLSKGGTIDPSREQNFQNKHKLGSIGSTSMDQVTILEVSIPFVFRAVVSLHPAGSINPNSAAFFSPDEGGNYMHASGSSVYHVYKLITEHADKALQYFLSAKSNSALSNLLLWIDSYQTLFTQVCSKCGRLLIMDKSLGLLLPPVYRDYRQCPTTRLTSSQAVPSMKEQTLEHILSYHIGCYSEGTL